MEIRKHNFKNNEIIFIILFIINFIISIGIAIFIPFLLIYPRLLNGKNLNEYQNDYCTNITNDYYDLLCTNKYFKHNYKKTKFIWILTDGIATDQLVNLKNLEKYNITTSFLNIGNYIKYTNGLHETIISGKYNKNYFGSKINYDNILQQAKNAGYKINYRGWSTPIPGIIGDDSKDVNNNNFFNKKYIIDEYEELAFSSFCNITNPFPFLKLDFEKYQESDKEKVNDELKKKIIEIIDKFRDYDYYLLKNTSKFLLFEELDKLFEENPIDLFSVNIDECLKKSFGWENNNENISILYYTTEVDHSNHLFGKNHIYTMLQVYIVEKMILKLMKWIDSHGDYALIINSDHGGQYFYSEDTTRMHGEDFHGNEGILFIYIKEFKDYFDNLKMNERYIDVLDENAIIAQILTNISIPLESKGIPYQLINDDIYAFSSLKMKEIQLKKLIESYSGKYKKHNNELSLILNELDNKDINIIINEYIEIYNKIGKDKKKEFKNLIKNNLDTLINQQKIIMGVIKKNIATNINIYITIIVFIVLISKNIFELYFLFKLIINKYFNYYTKSTKFFLIFFTVFYLFILEFISLFFFNTTIKLQLFSQLYLFITIIIMIIIFCIIKNNNLFNTKTIKNIYYYIIMISGYLFFQVISTYSYSFLAIKQFFSRYYTQLFLNIFFLYPLLIIIIFKEIQKYNIKNIKGFDFAYKYLIVINIIFIIDLFIEDISSKTYYSQNTLNSISMYIGIVIYLIYFLSCFIINSLDIIKNNNNTINTNKKLVQNIKKYDPSSIMPVNLFEINVYNKKKVLSFNIIDNNSKKTSNNDLNKNNVQNNKYFNLMNNYPCLKLCILEGSFWFSEESERIYIFLCLIFFEFSEYINNFFYSNTFNEKDSSNNQSLELNNTNTNTNTNNNKNKKNISIYLYIYFIISQKVILIINHIFYLLVQHSYSTNSAKTQQQKFIKISSICGIMIAFISKYRFSFIIVGYLLKKNFFDKSTTKTEFSLFFIIQKIILYLRLNYVGIFLFYNLLIKIRDEEFLQLIDYYFVDFSVIFFDYLVIVLSLIF